ncbi:MAG: TerB family tellurite resistance protein [Steroidobacteraceae bacterium]
MAVILAALGSIVAILILLKGLADAGIDLGGLNPFLWRRRRQWREKIHGNPIFSVQDPRDLAALLVVGVAKVDGDISAEEKRAVLEEFAKSFALKPRDAVALLGSSVYLLGDPRVLMTQLDDVLRGALDKFTSEQVISTLAMMERIAAAGGAPSEPQRELIEAVRSRLSRMQPAQGTWA